MARQINSAQSQGLAHFKTFFTLADLPDVVTPEGFAAQLITSSTGYAFSIKDTLDPCGFAVFSDQRQVIYTGEPIRGR